MPKNNAKPKIVKKRAEDIKYSFNQLFQSNRFKRKYQIDTAKVVLGDKFYSVEEAERILNMYFNKK